MKNNVYKIPHLVLNSAFRLIEAALQGLGIIAISSEFAYLTKSPKLEMVLANEGGRNICLSVSTNPKDVFT